MHSSRDGTRLQHGSTAPDSARSEQKHTSTSSFVSTLSNALNISTPTSSRKPTLSSTAQSTPTRYTHAAPSSHQATPTRPDALRTPIRAADGPRILTLSGHEAFQSPTTPLSPWTSAPFTEPLGHASYATAPTTEGPDACISRVPEQDQDWLLSGPTSRRALHIFGSRSKTPAPAAPASQNPSSVEREAIHLEHSTSFGPSNTSALAEPHQQNFGTSAGPFYTYREQPSSDPRIGIYEINRMSSDVPTSQAVLSPMSAAALSPTQFSSTFPAGFSDSCFMSTMFEQDTPSLSTHLLPSQDLTEQLPQGFRIVAPTTSGKPLSPSAHTFVFSMRPNQPDPNAHLDSIPSQAHTNQIGSPHGLVNEHSATSGRMTHTAAPTASAQDLSSIHMQPAPGIVNASRVNSATPGQNLDAISQRSMHDDVYSSGNVLGGEGNRQTSSTSTRADQEIAGLGLQLNVAPVGSAKPVESIEPASTNSYRSSVLVDELGRWILDSEGQPIGMSDQSSLSTTDSRGRRVIWHGKDTSNTSLGATTEASFTSHSNSSTWYTSFNDMTSPASGPPSASADSQFIPTPASSIGVSFNNNPQPNKLTERLSVASDTQPPPMMTPEVAMHDFSEFGQSISIEQMADERWRTWPRNRDSVLLRERPSNSTIPMSSEPVPQPPADERTSFDSLSVSASSTRSRLMAEPYNKNMRSGRPSSSASTSSRSSIGNAAALEGQQSTGVTGPTRPISYIATGSLRMSSTTRSGSNGVAGSDEGPAPIERLSGTALALRRARGMSQGGPPRSSSSNAMKLTRSSDALLASGSSASSSAKFRHSVALQRTALSSDGLAQAAAQRPQSLLETSAGRIGVPSAKQTGKVDFNEVSVALDTLRMFLKQKEKSDTVGDSTCVDETVESNEASSPSKPGRTLRRTKGILPPRGAFSSVDEFGTLQTSASASNISSLNDALGVLSAHDPSQSVAGGLIGLSQSARSAHSSSRQDDRLAVLEDLSERVMKLKADTERQKEQHAAASMPPPPARSASVQHQRSQSNMTRREMHEQYLRKRANGP